MKLAELTVFLEDCIKAKIAFPRNTMTFLVEDFYEVVPEDKQFNYDELEYNVKVDQEMARVFIKPKTEKPYPDDI